MSRGFFISYENMKILFCDNSLRELLNFRKVVIDAYVAWGCEVVLVAPKNCEYIPDSSLIKLIPVKMNRSGKNPFQDLKYCNTLRVIYGKEKPDYIFHYTIKPNIYGTLAAALCGIRSSAMIAGLGYVFNKAGIGNRMARGLYRFALRFADFVLVLNGYNYQFLQDNRIVTSQKLILLKGGEGIDLSHFRPQETMERSDKIRFLMISRLLYDKGYQEYVDAAKAIRRIYPECEFQLLGNIDPDYPNHVPEQQVLKDQREGYIQYLEYHPDVLTYIQQAVCIVLPSFYNEGLSRVLMEGLAMGKPIITTDIPGCRETVIDGKNGYLIRPRDTESLIEAVKKFLNLSYTDRGTMGIYGRRMAEEVFDIQEVVKIYKRITDRSIDRGMKGGVIHN